MKRRVEGKQRGMCAKVVGVCVVSGACMCISSGCIRGGWRLHVSWLTCGEFASEQRVRLLGRLCAQWNLKVDKKSTKTGWEFLFLQVSNLCLSVIQISVFSKLLLFHARFFWLVLSPAILSELFWLRALSSSRYFNIEYFASFTCYFHGFSYVFPTLFTLPDMIENRWMNR